MTDLDQPGLAARAGFDADKVHMGRAAPGGGVKHAYNPDGFSWPVLVGVK